MPPAIQNWRTTLISIVLTLGPYALMAYGLWPNDILPLPPFDKSWQAIIGIIGVGALAKDAHA